MTGSGSRDGKLSEILAELKAEYRTQFPRKLQKLRTVFDGGDRDALREEFHKLKGTGKTYGFPEVSILCEVMEHACARGTADAAMIESALSVLNRMQEKWAVDKSFDVRQDEEALKILALGKGSKT